MNDGQIIPMNLGRQILVVVLSFGLSFIFIRSFIHGIKRYQLNTSAYKKRKKGETFKEWFLYSRYREEIPGVIIILYFAVIAVHALVLLTCIINNFINPLDDLGRILATAIFYLDGIWTLCISLLFWQKKPGFKYERWIEKRRGNKK